jgi:hypothetical protein
VLRAWLVVGLRLLACTAVTYLVWRRIGLIGVVVCLPLYGISLARPILDLLGGTREAARRLTFRAVDGRHYEHRGHMIDILEDEARHRWLRLADVRKVIPGLPSDPALRHQFPAGVQALAPSTALRIQAESLAEYLQKSTEPDSLKFKLWLEREVMFPARQVRARSKRDG